MKFTVIVITSVILAAAAVAAVAVAVGRRAFAAAVEVPKVRVEPAARGPLVELISVPGEIQPRTKVSISPRVAARIAEIPHPEGSTVRRADPAATRPARESLLVLLDAKDLESALRSATARAAAQNAQIKVSESKLAGQRATLVAAKAQLDDARRDLDRKRELSKTRDVPQSEADTALARFDELAAQLEAARFNLTSEEQTVDVLRYQQEASEAEIAKARDELAYTVITSPIDGVVTKVRAEAGEQVVPGVQGSVGSTILEVADLSQMLMVARIDEANVAAVRPGQRATVRIQAYRDEKFDGVVESVALAKADPSQAGGSSRSREGSDYYEAKIRLDVRGRRIPTGLNADADIESQRVEGIRVPSQAVLARPTDGLPADVVAAAAAGTIEREKSTAPVVYRYADGKAVVTPVKVGPSDETHTLVLLGLAEGDAVMTGPYKALDALQHGQAVTKEDVPAKASSRPTTGPAATPTIQPATGPATGQAAGMTKSE